MLVSELLCRDNVSLLLDRKIAHSVVQAGECLTVFLQSLLIELQKTAEAFRKVRGLEDVSRLDVRLLVQNLRDQVLVDLTQCTVQHLSSFEHVEEAIGEDLLSMADTIDVEDVLVRCQARVDHEVQGCDVEGQSECILFELLIELKICNYRVCSLRLIFDWVCDVALLEEDPIGLVRHICSWMDVE